MCLRGISGEVRRPASISPPLFSGTQTGWAIAFLGFLVLDSVPRPTSAFPLDHPAIYDVLLRQSEPGAVCELPIGLRDGFGETGIFDSRTLWYQTIHKRPMTGGFVAR